ncbi:MAG: hypothetical protein R3F31_20270 [Verrucomicrobiales bacterium]
MPPLGRSNTIVPPDFHEISRLGFGKIGEIDPNAQIVEHFVKVGPLAFHLPQTPTPSAWRFTNKALLASSGKGSR